MSAPKHLTHEQLAHFLEHGYIHLNGCFSRAAAHRWTSDMWTRLGYDASDPSTWLTERINMPSHRSESIKTFAPSAWQAICDLLGGEDRIAPSSAIWDDGLIVNFGCHEPGEAKTGEVEWTQPRDLRGWHVDGDSFTHFLNSPEQGLLVLPLFSDIQPRGGGTIICPEGIKAIAQHLYNHPEGVSPHMTPKHEPPFTSEQGLSYFNSIPQSASNFIEATGNIGDVYLMHPFMLHSASTNSLGIPRIITNPRVALKVPFSFHRTDGTAYSIVERCTIKALGRDAAQGLLEWAPKGQPEAIVSEREIIQRRMRGAELSRLRGEKMEPERLRGWNAV